MIKLALLGTLSSHTENFCQCAAKCPDVQIIGIYGEDPDRTAYLRDTYGLAVKTPEELLEQCDAAAIMFRDGGKHLRYASPFIRKQKPVFIDKPFTTSVAEAEELLALLKKFDCPFVSGSTLRFAPELPRLKAQIAEETKIISGYCAYPIMLDTPWGGMHFYSHHLIELMLQLFGTEVRSITAKRSGNALSAIAAYDGFHVLMDYGVQEHQAAIGYTGKDGQERLPLPTPDATMLLLRQIIETAQTRRSPMPGEYFLRAVQISCAIERAMDSGSAVSLV